jgi:type IV secretory pathway VirB2 component (pilin)
VNELASGWGRALVFVYGVFAVAATGRSTVQLGLHADRAPLAYSLSLLAAVIYLVATTCLLLGGRTGWRVACVAVSVELLGVLSVGTLSYVATELFPDRTVWSHFGQGYGFLPLVLPFAGLAWLRHTRATGH